MFSLSLVLNHEGLINMQVPLLTYELHLNFFFLDQTLLGIFLRKCNIVNNIFLLCVRHFPYDPVLQIGFRVSP